MRIPPFYRVAALTWIGKNWNDLVLWVAQAWPEWVHWSALLSALALIFGGDFTPVPGDAAFGSLLAGGLTEAMLVRKGAVKLIRKDEKSDS